MSSGGFTSWVAPIAARESFWREAGDADSWRPSWYLFAVRIACWNIQHPGTTEKLRTVVGVVATLECDVLALQEVAPAVVYDLKTLLRQIDLSHAAVHEHANGWWLLTASRHSMRALPPIRTAISRAEQDYPRIPAVSGGEVARILSTEVSDIDVVVHNVHVPPGSKAGWRKIDTLRAVPAALDANQGKPQIVCGDFNEPMSEEPTGTLRSWACRNNFARANPERWEEAVRAALRGELADDCFQAVHHEAVCTMWSHRRAKKNRRYDHVLATPSLRPTSARYLDVACSDHKPAVVDLQRR